MGNQAIKSVSMGMAFMASVWATGAPVYDFAAGFNGTLTPDVQPAGSAAPVATGTGAAVSNSIYKYGTGSLQVMSDATGAIKYDWSKVPVTGAGTVGFWYNPSYTPSAASGGNTLFQAVAPASSGGWVSGVKLSRMDTTLTLALNWDNDWSYDSVNTSISGLAAGDWHYISCQWARGGAYVPFHLRGWHADGVLRARLSSRSDQDDGFHVRRRQQ